MIGERMLLRNPQWCSAGELFGHIPCSFEETDV